MLTPKDLTEALKIALKAGETASTSQAGLRYAIYARKSTESEERQVRSLGDQVIECEQLAEKAGIKVLKVVKESESAKEPDIRPKFRALLEELKKGKLDGIIAWHPDRLARNMKDAGEVIDLLDKGIIKDLRFVSFSFENNTMGKMLLGVAFVMSKQYSDQLSDNVRRGIRRSLEEGKYLHRSKHGYVKDRNQLLRPDGENYALIKNAFQMRLAGKTLEGIAQYLNESGYTRAPAMSGQRKTYKMDNKRVSEFLRDPVCAGVLLYGDNITNLTEVYDFLPMITVDEFKKLNRVSDINRAFRLTKRYHQPGVIKADLMRGMVICWECEEPMTACITSKKAKEGTTKYFYYR